MKQAADKASFNTSPFTLSDVMSRASQQKLKADVEAYLDGFSPNVQNILENFEFRNQIPQLSKADALGILISKFLSPDINLSPVSHAAGRWVCQAIPASTTTPWARCSRSWCAASARRTTRRPASNGRHATA